MAMIDILGDRLPFLMDDPKCGKCGRDMSIRTFVEEQSGGIAVKPEHLQIDCACGNRVIMETAEQMIERKRRETEERADPDKLPVHRRPDPEVDSAD